MSKRLPYSTTAGQVTKSELLAQIIEYLIYLQEACAMYGHLCATEDSNMDRLLAKGWLGMAELFKRMQHTVIQMAQGKLQS
jgi:hypothetical protein